VQVGQIADRLKELKNEMRDKIDECQDFEEDPDSFEPAAFASLQQESQKCYAECISIFSHVRAQILEPRIVSPVDQLKDDRVFLTSMREQPLSRKPVPSGFTEPQFAQAEFSHASLGAFAVEPPKSKSSCAINSPSQFDIGPSAQLTARRLSSRDISPSSLPIQHAVDPQPNYIAKEVVRYRISANDEFLERRRQSKITFQNELRKQSISSSPSARSMERPSTADKRISGAIEENRVSGMYEDGSFMPIPQFGNHVMASSPVEGRLSMASSSSYDRMVSGQRSLRQNSQDTRNSRTSSFLHDGIAQRQDLHRQDSITSQDSIFGNRAAAQSPTLPLSPPLSDHGISGSLDIGNLAATLKTPQFGQNVEDGMEVVENPSDWSSEKIAVDRSNNPNAENCFSGEIPAESVKLVEYPMRYNTSFYQFRGFCEGAGILMRGRTGEDWYKIVKRPSGHYSATVSAKCSKCSYEVGYNDLQKDKILDRWFSLLCCQYAHADSQLVTGIYMNSHIRWRQRFITKSHLRATNVESGTYACIFCVEEQKTVEDHDATVFFSVQQLFRHLAKHPQPLPRVSGVTVIYGLQPLTVLDFDIHFTTSVLKVPEFSMSEIHQKVATRPSAHAYQTYHPKQNTSGSRSPTGEPVLHFAMGARIVGITFPERFKGEWCSGYHDGERGSFPASAITLEQPAPEEYMMNTKSTLVATAKWDFKPKDAKDVHWLKFSKGERISCIGYSFVDHWCWSGQNSKGKWGIFPQAFVANLVDGTSFPHGTSPGTARNSTFGSRISGFSLGRRSARHDRSGSIRSTGSGGSVGMIHEEQPGLEIANSPSTIQPVRTVGSWRR